VSGTAWQESRLKRLQVSLIAGLGYPLLALLGATLRWRVEGLEYYERALSGGRPPIIGFWHGRILPGTYYFKRRGIVVITSQNFDGEWIARIIARFGYGAARGSSSANARGALRELMRHIRGGRSVAFTLDGPRGPAREAKAGAVWLASVTGSPIVPFHAEASRAWTARSWDRTQVPQPFSRVSLVIGEPLDVPSGADADGLEVSRLELERRLEHLSKRALALSQQP
jgi:lysophospholipid acyltransferase (LPLAT)-like uncharacterized protein